MTSRELEYIKTVADEKSISAAARKLYIAQPSLSQVLKEVEEEVGFKIFQRDRRGAEETKAGAELLEQLEEVWKLWKEMREELGEYRELKKGTVTIGIPMNLGACSGSCVSQALSGGKGIYP
mgnify:CR=1 FL=1